MGRIKMEKQELKDNQDTIYKTLIKASRGNKNGIDCAYRRKDLFLKINLCKKKTLGDRLFRRIFADMVLAGYNVGSCSGIGYLTCSLVILYDSGFLLFLFILLVFLYLSIHLTLFFYEKIWSAGFLDSEFNLCF